jgi:hypothetical protein
MHGKVDRNRGADGAPGERDRPVDVEGIEQGDEIIDHRVEAKDAAHFFRLPGAARVVAQYLPPHGKRRQHLIPAVEAAAHLVHQHQCFGAIAGKVIAKPDPVRLKKIHPYSPSP